MPPTWRDTFTPSTLESLVTRHSADWNAYVDSWRAFFNVLGRGTGTTVSTSAYRTAGQPITRNLILGIQTALEAYLPTFIRPGTNPVGAAATAMGVVNSSPAWEFLTLATARADAGLAGSNWSRNRQRIITSTSATTYSDGVAVVNGEFARLGQTGANQGRVYLRSGGAWALQPKGTQPTRVADQSGKAVARDYVTARAFNECAAVAQLLYLFPGSTNGGVARGVLDANSTATPAGYYSDAREDWSTVAPAVPATMADAAASADGRYVAGAENVQTDAADFNMSPHDNAPFVARQGIYAWINSGTPGVGDPSYAASRTKQEHDLTINNVPAAWDVAPGVGVDLWLAGDTKSVNFAPNGWFGTVPDAKYDSGGGAWPLRAWVFEGTHAKTPGTAITVRVDPGDAGAWPTGVTTAAFVDPTYPRAGSAATVDIRVRFVRWALWRFDISGLLP